MARKLMEGAAPFSRVQRTVRGARAARLHRDPAVDAPARGRLRRRRLQRGAPAAPGPRHVAGGPESDRASTTGRQLPTRRSSRWPRADGPHGGGRPVDGRDARLLACRAPRRDRRARRRQPPGRAAGGEPSRCCVARSRRACAPAGDRLGHREARRLRRRLRRHAGRPAALAVRRGRRRRRPARRDRLPGALLSSSRVDHVVPPESGDLVEGTVAGPVERVWLERSFHVATLDHDAAEIEARAVAFVKKLMVA